MRARPSGGESCGMRLCHTDFVVIARDLAHWKNCVGVNATLGTGIASLARRGRLTMVGAGGGAIPFDFYKMPAGAELACSASGMCGHALLELGGMELHEIAHVDWCFAG